MALKGISVLVIVVLNGGIVLPIHRRKFIPVYKFARSRMWPGGHES